METTMTNFFGLNITKGQEGTELDGAAFQTAAAPPELEAEFTRLQTQDEQFKKQAALPMPLSILKFLCWFGWVIILASILKSDVSLAEGYHNAPAVFWICAICFIVWLILFLYGKKRMKKVEKTPDLAEHFQDSDELIARLRQSLGIPFAAKEIDVLAERYVMHDGKPKHKSSGMVDYINLNMSAYTEKGNLCLADIHQRWEIPLTSIRSMTLVKKRVSFPEWHKDEPIGSAKYKPYKVTNNNYGHYFAHYYRIEIRDIRGDFYLLIPNFDGEVFTELTHIKPEEIQK